MKDSFRHTPFRREQPAKAQRGSVETMVVLHRKISKKSNTVYVLCRRC